MQTQIDWTSVAVIVVDPQVDLLSAEGQAWDLFGEQVTKRRVVENLRALRDAADHAGVPLFYSRIEIPDRDYESWSPRNGLQSLMRDKRLLVAGRGAKFLPELEPTKNTILLSPRKGPSSVQSDVADQLRSRGIDTILVAGMVANLCVESQVRDAVDDGFRAIVVGDAVATVSDEAHEAALANFGLLATEIVNTEDVVELFAQAPVSAPIN